VLESPILYLVMYSENFNNIQSLIKVTKTLNSPITGEQEILD